MAHVNAPLYSTTFRIRFFSAMRLLGEFRLSLFARFLPLAICVCLFSESHALANRPAAYSTRNIGIVADSEPIDFETLFAEPDPVPVVDEIVTFIQPGSSLDAEISLNLIPWTPDEVERVKGLLRRIFSSAPGLMKLVVGPSGKLEIGRSKEIIAGRKMHKVAAITRNECGVMILSNLAFKGSSSAPDAIHNELYEILVHELVHAADCGYRLSHSREWVNFAGPRLLSLQKELEQIPAHEEYKRREKIIDKYRWPSVYGSENLTEALAEFFVSYYFQTRRSSLEFEKRFAPWFLSPTEQERCFLLHYKRGAAFFFRGSLIAAVKEFTCAREYNPDSAVVNVRLMQCYDRLHDYVNALRSADKAIACSEAAGVPQESPEYYDARFTKYCLLLEVGRIDVGPEFKELFPWSLDDSDMQQLKEELIQLQKRGKMEMPNSRTGAGKSTNRSENSIEEQ